MILKTRILFLKNSVILYLTFLYEIEGKHCHFNVEVEQTLHNEGFHRNLSINIDYASDREEEKWLYEDCMVGVEQVLPSGIYATLEEINDNKCPGLIHTIFKTPVNIELPARKSEPIFIHLLSKVRNYRTHIDIPVHARYHHAVPGGGTIRNEIPAPKLYLLCPDDRLHICEDLYDTVSSDNKFCIEHQSKEKCLWKEIPIVMMTAPVSWEVPVGNTQHYPVVACCTALVVAAGSLYLLSAVHHYTVRVERNNKKKQL